MPSHWSFWYNRDFNNFLRRRVRWLDDPQNVAWRMDMFEVFEVTQRKYPDYCFHREFADDPLEVFRSDTGDDWYPYFAALKRKYWNRLKQDVMKMRRSGNCYRWKENQRRRARKR